MSIEFREEMEKLVSLISTVKNEDSTSEVASELETIFGVSGSQALLRVFSMRYGVSLRDAIKRPGVFQQALFFLLGDLGSSLVMERINKRVWGVAKPAAPPVLGAY
jgi:hypothetical protein